MHAVDVEEIESSFKINMRDKSWWMSIKETCTPGALVTTILSKEWCISLVTRGRPFHTTHRHG
jgi:hypothetical protein